MKKIIAILMSISMIFALSACGDDNKAPINTENPKATESVQNEEDLYLNKIGFTIELEDGGVMKGELYPDVAPVTVENFVKLANEKFYDGLIFHRVIEGFMIQGGGFDEKYTPKQSKAIKGEFDANGIKNPLKHDRGVISMARTNVPDSASSQFFIMHEKTPNLDGQYAAFGKVTEGLDIIDEIASVKTTILAEYGMQDVPAEPIVIKTITVENKAENK